MGGGLRLFFMMDSWVCCRTGCGGGFGQRSGRRGSGRGSGGRSSGRFMEGLSWAGRWDRYRWVSGHVRRVVQAGRRVGARLITLVTKNTENAGSPTPSAPSFPERGTRGPQPQADAQPQPQPQTIVPMLYQFRFPCYLPCVKTLANQCAPGRNRTCDQRLRRPLLYPLSYRRMGGRGERI